MSGLPVIGTGYRFFIVTKSELPAKIALRLNRPRKIEIFSRFFDTMSGLPVITSDYRFFILPKNELPAQLALGLNQSRQFTFLVGLSIPRPVYRLSELVISFSYFTEANYEQN